MTVYEVTDTADAATELPRGRAGRFAHDERRTPDAEAVMQGFYTQI